MNNRQLVRPRQFSPLRKPWHIDYIIQHTMLRDIVAHKSRVQGRLLDVGCGNRPYAPWLSAVQEYIGLDVHYAGSTPDVGGIAYALPFVDASFDSVISTQTLEHVEEPQCAIAEMARVLRPGGYLLVTAPQTWRLHEQPYDYYRYTRYGLEYLLRQSGLEVVEIAAQGGVWATVGQIVNNAVHKRLRPHISGYAISLIYLASNLCFGILDRFWVDHEETLNYYAIAQKPV